MLKKFKFLLPALLAFSMGLAIGAARADSDTDESADAMEVTGLNKHAGKLLKVLYISGTPAKVGVSGQEVTIDAVLKTQDEIKISSKGNANVLATQFPQVDFKAFNYVMFSAAASPEAQPDYLGVISVRKLRTLPRSSTGILLVDSLKDLKK